LRVCADAEGNIERGLLTHFKDDGLRGLTEALTLDEEMVAPGLESGDLIEPCAVCHHFAFRTGIGGGETDMRAGDRAMMWVEDRPANDGIIALSLGCDESGGDAENNGEDSTDH
jgi:hypothetical protein